MQWLVTWGSVTTHHDVGGVWGRPLNTFFWVLTISWSLFSAHVWSGPNDMVGLGRNNPYTHSLKAGKGLGIQQGMSVWVSSPKSTWSWGSHFPTPTSGCSKNFDPEVYHYINLNKKKQWNREALSSLMKDYNCRCPVCTNQSMTIYYIYNQTIIGFRAPCSQMQVKD